MIDWFRVVFEVLGGLGLLFYGMRLLSESLQAISGVILRKLVGILTNNRLVALVVGVVLTSIVQSSSITTVMVVGFVNAGLMSLTQAVGIILGANIGTTITGWILALKVGKYALLIIGLSFLPMLFTKHEKVIAWARVFFALGLLFLGLMIMKEAFSPLKKSEEFTTWMTYVSADNYLSLFAAIVVGCVLTMVIQSSSSVLGITIALASSGVIEFQSAVALVMGENVGTTIAAVLASFRTNTAGRRTALAHSVFNLVGVSFLVLIFWQYVPFIDSLISGDVNYLDAEGHHPYVGAHIAASHTIFNVIAAIIVLPFLKQLTRFVEWVLPQKEGELEKLEYIGDANTSSPELALQLADLELNKMASITKKAVSFTHQYILEEKENTAIRDKILKYETITDTIHQEIMNFTGKLMQAALTNEETRDVKRLLRMSDELESIADYCQKIVQQVRRLHEQKDKMPEEGRQQLGSLMGISYMYVDLIFGLFEDKVDVLEEEHSQWSDSFNQNAEQVREYFLNLVKEGVQPPLVSLAVSDCVLAMRRIYSHTKNIYESKRGFKINKSKPAKASV